MEKTFRIVSFQEAEELDIEYWKKATPEEKLDTLQALREMYYDLKNEDSARIKVSPPLLFVHLSSILRY